MKFMLSKVGYGVVYSWKMHPVQRRDWNWMRLHMIGWTRFRKKKHLLRATYGTKYDISLGVIAPEGWEFKLTNHPAQFYRVRNLNLDYFENGYTMVKK